MSSGDTGADSNSTYFKEWYRDNGDELNKSRRERYHSDPEYKEKILQQNREARRKRREAALKEKKARKSAQKTRSSQSWKSVNIELTDDDGNKVVQKMFTIGAVAKALDCSVQALRLWEKKKFIPETPFRYSKGDRLYTKDQIETMRNVLTAKGRIGTNKVRSRPLPYVEKKILLNGRKRARKTKLFRIGILAKTVGRTVVTLEQLEQKGALPATPFRASDVGYRLYTQRMMEAVKNAFDDRGGEIRGEEAWSEFHDAVYKAWDKQNVIGASIAE
jgi:DNA-binding transcriptional MerR regulator